MNRYIKALFLVPILFCVILIFILFFHRTEPPTSPITDNNPPPEAVSGNITAAPLSEYLLIAEDNYLNLYLVGEKLSLKHSEYFDRLSLPPNDISLLSHGLQFESIEKAYEAMEGFIN